METETKQIHAMPHRFSRMISHNVAITVDAATAEAAEKTANDVLVAYQTHDDLIMAIEAARSYVIAEHIKTGANTTRRTLEAIDATLTKARGKPDRIESMLAENPNTYADCKTDDEVRARRKKIIGGEV